MQFSSVLAVSVAMLASMTQGYRISNCASPKTHNLGNNQCHRWTDTEFTFQSNKGCTLRFFSEPDCQGHAGGPRRQQNHCQKVGFNPKSMRCTN